MKVMNKQTVLFWGAAYMGWSVTIAFLVAMSTVEVQHHITKPWPFERIEAEVTAYTAHESETDDRPWEMADGRTVFEGAAACPEYLEFGKKIYIDGKEYECADRMNKRYRGGPYFDILVESKHMAKNFGRQTKIVLIKN